MSEQLERQGHIAGCVELAKAALLNSLLAEIEREDYQSASQVKESIKCHLKLIYRG